DEPTNHLDIDTREALAEALQEFTGAVVLVAHDRGLLRAVCDEYLLVRDGRVRRFDGDLDDYARLVLERDRTSDDAPRTSGDNRRDARRERAEARQKLAPLRKEVQRIEARLAMLESERSDLAAQLADPQLYAGDSTARIADLTRQQGHVGAEIAALEAAWLDAQAALD